MNDKELIERSEKVFSYFYICLFNGIFWSILVGFVTFLIRPDLVCFCGIVSFLGAFALSWSAIQICASAKE